MPLCGGMEIIMNKFIKIIASTSLIAAIAVTPVLAARPLTVNFAGGCKTTAAIKKADASAIKHDGIISPGEYEEITINRNSDLDSAEPMTDLLFTGEDSVNAMNKCLAILETVHFYMSWDEVHGLNVAAKVTYPETPKSDDNYQPDATYYPDKDFPGDEFLFQFGMMFKTVVDGSNNLYRGISKQTKTGELLYGHYGVHGLTGELHQSPHNDYEVGIDGNTVTYEISFPLESVLSEKQRNGNIANDGEKIEFAISIVGGSEGKMHENASTNAYALSLGDGGYMVQWTTLGEEKSNAFGIFSSESIVTQGSGNTDETTVGTTSAATNGDSSSSAANGEPSYSIADNNQAQESSSSDTTNTSQANSSAGSVKAPSTGDPMLITAALASVSALAAAFVKKRKF